MYSIIALLLQDAEPVEEQPKKNTRDKIIKGVQDSYVGSGEPVDAKATIANAQDKAEELKDKSSYFSKETINLIVASKSLRFVRS